MSFNHHTWNLLGKGETIKLYCEQKIIKKNTKQCKEIWTLVEKNILPKKI